MGGFYLYLQTATPVVPASENMILFTADGIAGQNGIAVRSWLIAFHHSIGIIHIEYPGQLSGLAAHAGSRTPAIHLLQQHYIRTERHQNMARALQVEMPVHASPMLYIISYDNETGSHLLPPKRFWSGLW